MPQNPARIRGSRARFGLIWGMVRARIQARHDPVAASRWGEGMRQRVQEDQDREMRRLEEEIEEIWQGELGRLWQWKERVDWGLLREHVAGLAQMQADDLRPGSKKWEIVEGVIGMLGELGDAVGQDGRVD